MSTADDLILQPGKWRGDFRVCPPLTRPYFNRWGEPARSTAEKFSDNPFTVAASSTSGSPLVIDGSGRFFGFTSGEPAEGCSFCFDGKETLTVEVPEGQVLLFGAECGDGLERWRAFNKRVIGSMGGLPEVYPEWSAVEYCTWVEQKRLARNATPFEVLNENFLKNYVRRIQDLGLPRGKVTIDHGWQAGDETYGDWDAHPERFPDLRGAIEGIRDAGFFPGIWMAPIWLHPRSRVARRHPEFLGEIIQPSTPDGPRRDDAWHYWNEHAPFEEILAPRFSELISMGVRKFKFDMSYARKDLMMRLHARVYRSIKEIDPAIEVEIHQPDIFFARYGDAIRANDVLCNSRFAWRELTKVHFQTCRRSAPGKVLNLDHIGGNDPDIDEQTFQDHLEIFVQSPGHPVVSGLWDFLSGSTLDSLRTYLNKCAQNHKAVSDFY